jgi:predicted alpha/beta-fold hydrolase
MQKIRWAEATFVVQANTAHNSGFLNGTVGDLHEKPEDTPKWSDPNLSGFSRWLPGGNAQTLYAALLAPVGRPRWQRERWETPDDDFIDVDFLAGEQGAPVLVIFHGLEGSSASPYASALALDAQARRWSVVAPNFRSCGGSINRAPRIYHAGDSAEIQWILARVRQRHGGPVTAVGISLGGNMMLKWMGEQGERATLLLDRAAAVAAPLDLTAVGLHLAQGFNRVYTRHFLGTLKPKARAKFNQYPGLFDLKAVLQARTMREFDDAFMAPLHGFDGVDDYWTRCSSKPWLQHIRVPTLLLASRDDPFIPDGVLPPPSACPPSVIPCYTAHGGHVGFVTGRFPGHLGWMPQRVLAFLDPDRIV